MGSLITFLLDAIIDQFSGGSAMDFLSSQV